MQFFCNNVIVCLLELNVTAIPPLSFLKSAQKTEDRLSKNIFCWFKEGRTESKYWQNIAHSVKISCKLDTLKVVQARTNQDSPGKNEQFNFPP